MRRDHIRLTSPPKESLAINGQTDERGVEWRGPMERAERYKLASQQCMLRESAVMRKDGGKGWTEGMWIDYEFIIILV